MRIPALPPRLRGFGKQYLLPAAPLPRPLLALLALAAIVSFLGAACLLLLPPPGFPEGRIIIVPEDVPVSVMAEGLERDGVIRSAFLFHAYTRLLGMDRELASGTYLFSRAIGLAPVAHRLARGEHGIEPARVTLTEGMTVDDMSQELSRSIPGFDAEAFLDIASSSEGYLFPDTYLFMPTATPEEVYARLRSRFDDQVASASPELSASGRPIADIVIVASLLEREANTLEDKRIISGILWKRLDQGMPLQVDAVFGYIRGVNGYTPTAADLELDSPYNTYKYEGLPPSPISNPGLESLLAAAMPTETEYLYYLTGRDGLMRYGRTFEEHKRNRALYLD